MLALPLAWIAVAAIAVALLIAFHQRTALVTPLVAALGATGALGMQELARLRRERLRLVEERLSAERATISRRASSIMSPTSCARRCRRSSGFGRLIGQDGSGTSDRQDYAQVIVRNSTHLLRLVNNLLDDARMATGHLVADPQPASVRQVVRDVVATVDGLPRGEGVEVLAHVEADVPERLLIDELRVRQIVLNLVANAAKFTEQGHIRLDVAWRADTLRIAVEDTGPGIEPEAIDRVFEEFEFGSPAAARAGGSGLGLSVSRRLARLMGGDLVLASTTVGAGTRFVLTVPARAVAPLSNPAAQAAADAATPPAAGHGARGSRRGAVGDVHGRDPGRGGSRRLEAVDPRLRRFAGHPPAAVRGPRSSRRRGDPGADRRGRPRVARDPAPRRRAPRPRSAGHERPGRRRAPARRPLRWPGDRGDRRRRRFDAGDAARAGLQRHHPQADARLGARRGAGRAPAAVDAAPPSAPVRRGSR